MSKNLDKYDLSELKSRIESFDNTKKDLESTIKLLEQDVKDKKVVDVSEKEKQLDTINEEYKNLDDMYTKLNATLEKLKSSTANIEKYLEDNKKIQSEYDVIKVLSDTANGSLTGKQRITFENYVQSYFMQSVLIEANKRLIKMTDSRYELKRKETDVKLNVKTGLDFSIFDSYTGKERDVASLSGGEKFMSSLALALGLSDAISNSRGGIKIDSLFIDEGFGSLDSESLSQALNILSDLSGNDKLVGVISHVSELMNRIDNKILVNKTNIGSVVNIEAN
jgi:exonuclease SbcC